VPRNRDVSPDVSPAKPPDEALEVEESGPGLSLFDASGDTRVRCLWKDPTRQKWTTHGYFPPDVTEETLLKLFGGGEYMLQLLVQGNEGREEIKQTRRVKLIGPHRIPAELPGIHTVNNTSPAQQSAAPVVGTISGGGGDMLSMLNATVMTTFMDLLKTMKEVSNRPAPSTDPMILKMMESQAAVQGKLIELMLANGGGKSDTKKDFMDLLELVKGIMPSPAATGDPNKVLESVVSAVKQLRDVSEEFSPDKGSGDPLLDSIPRLVEVIAEEHQQRKGQQTPAATGQNPPRVKPPQGQQGQLQVPIWKRVLRREGPRLLQAAQAAKKPEPLATMIVEFMPSTIKGAMTEFFHRETTAVVQDVLTEVPGLDQFPVWVNELVEEVQFIMFPEEFDDGEEGEEEEEITAEELPEGTVEEITTTTVEEESEE
jgi:hypothetical protein